jgi:hypothetical protein
VQATQRPLSQCSVPAPQDEPHGRVIASSASPLQSSSRPLHTSGGAAAQSSHVVMDGIQVVQSTQVRGGGASHCHSPLRQRSRPGPHGPTHGRSARPSSVSLSQSSSRPLQTSGAVGLTPARVSSQSVPHRRVPASSLQQSAAVADLGRWIGVGAGCARAVRCAPGVVGAGVGVRRVTHKHGVHAPLRTLGAGGLARGAGRGARALRHVVHDAVAVVVEAVARLVLRTDLADAGT